MARKQHKPSLNVGIGADLASEIGIGLALDIALSLAKQGGEEEK